MYQAQFGGRQRARPSPQAMYVDVVRAEAIRSDDEPMDEPLSSTWVKADGGPRAVVESSMMTEDYKGVMWSLGSLDSGVSDLEDWIWQRIPAILKAQSRPSKPRYGGDFG